MIFTDEIRQAWNYIENTRSSVFLTGKPGTGKTTFLRYLTGRTAKTAIVAAPTGVAAINAGGVTLHSFFQLPLGPYSPQAGFPRDKFAFNKEKLRIIRALDLLIIDEISMVRADLLDAVDAALRRYRRNNRPFGGVQLLMLGDLAQLSPVVTPSELPLLEREYATPFFFSSHALAQTGYVTLQLTQVFRQRDDRRFLELLDHLRTGTATGADMQLLSSRYIPDFRPSEGYVRLTTHNHMAEDYNNCQLSLLPGREYAYAAKVEGEFPDSSFPTASTLRLKEGAQVMFLRNKPEQGYYNGKIGRVTSLSANSIQVTCADSAEPITVTPETWENSQYCVDELTGALEAKVRGRFTQYPLRPAWAVTIHKSQGLTLNRVVIDAGAAFAPGQVYVALSRCRTLDGVVLATPLTQSTIITDRRVDSFMSHEEERAAANTASYEELRLDYLRTLAADLASFTDVSEPIELLRRFIPQVGKGFAAQHMERFETEADRFSREITAVSYRWQQLLVSLPYSELESDAIRERIKASSAYFAGKLDSSSAFASQIAALVSTNKEHEKRLKDYRNRFAQAFRIKSDLTHRFSTDSFSTAAYLSAKGQATLKSSADATRPKRKKKEKKPKAPKEDTRRITLDLFLQGLTVAEIADQRSLTTYTIEGHLLAQLPDFDAGLLQDVPEDMCLEIAEAFRSNPGATDSRIRDLISSQPPYRQIRIVRAYMNSGLL